MEYLKWTDVDHLRHATLVALRDDKVPREIVTES